MEVSRFELSLFGGPKLQANSVTVFEDPRFGQDYFLRAEELTASIRWMSLLRGRIELDHILLSRPSLNLVRSSGGEWNIERWLPPASRNLGNDSAPHSSPARLSRIEIEDGRIDFKRGADKLPFALVSLSGYLTLQPSGRWFLDLEAHPMRASVVLQESGTLRLRGTVGGTWTRFQPADLTLRWESASLADAARLAHGSDYGLRGVMDADFILRIDPPGAAESAALWHAEGLVRLQGVHRWNLAARQDNPSISLKVSAQGRTTDARIAIPEWTLESPHSHLSGVAAFDWSRGFDPQLSILQSDVAFADLLPWAHAFIPALSADLTLDGQAALNAELAGWPLSVANLELQGGGLSLRTGVNRTERFESGPFDLSWNRSAFVLAPMSIALHSGAFDRSRRANRPPSVADGVFRVEGSLAPARVAERDSAWRYKLALSGQTTRLQQVRAALADLGWQFATNWQMEGSASLRFASSGSLRPSSAILLGQANLRDLRVTNSAVASPVLIAAATVDFSPAGRKVEIAGVQALGTEWKGTLEKKASDSLWTFDVSANRLDVAEFGRELARRPGLLDRVLPFSGPAGLTSQAQEAISHIAAHGHLHVDELALSSVSLESLDADAELEQGALILRGVQTDLYDGRLTGEFRSQLGPDLQYSFRGQIDRADLSQLASLSSRKLAFGGIGSGELEFSAHGFGRQAFLSSVQGEGFLHIQDASFPALSTSLQHEAVTGGGAAVRYRASSVSFRVDNGRIRVDPLLLSGREGQLEIVGDIDFTRRLNLRVQSSSRLARTATALDAGFADGSWLIGGTLDAPEITTEGLGSSGNEAVAQRVRR